jgi:hypothetical protein
VTPARFPAYRTRDERDLVAENARLRAELAALHRAHGRLVEEILCSQWEQGSGAAGDYLIRYVRRTEAW